MKKVLQEYVAEEAIYYSDFKGKLFKDSSIDVELYMQFNYRSSFDGGYLELHLTEDEAKDVLDFIKTRLSKETIKVLKKEGESSVNQKAVCDYLTNGMET